MHVSRQHIHMPKTSGDKIADVVVLGMGSWKFIIAQSIIVAAWMTLNSVGWFFHWDPMPFILLNLLFSTQAAYAAPIIMMSQNRAAAKDRARDDVEAEEVALLLDLSKQMHTMNKRQLDLLEKLRHE